MGTPGPRNFQLDLVATLVPNRVGSALYKLLIFQYLADWRNRPPAWMRAVMSSLSSRILNDRRKRTVSGIYPASK